MDKELGHNPLVQSRPPRRSQTEVSGLNPGHHGKNPLSIGLKYILIKSIHVTY